MKFFAAAVLLVCGSVSGYAQLTREQRLIDFQTLAAQFAKRYAPYEWKKAALGVDLLDIKPFLDRAAAASNDLEYYELCLDYVAQIDDAHVFFGVPSDFVATLDITTDLYDGKVLIDAISRARLPQRQFPFAVGDELVSMDGKPVADLMRQFTKYSIAGNPSSTNRLAAYYLAVRAQSLMPHAPDIGDDATVVIRRQNGDLETYTLPWTKTGVPMMNAGPVPTPKSLPRRSMEPPDQGDQAAPPEEMPAWLAGLKSWVHLAVSPQKMLIGVGETRPAFTMSSNFQQRLGNNPFTDYFFSGTYTAGGKTLGFIRIPDFQPDSPGAAIQQFEREITYMQANTDGLIVDVTRNLGGYGFYVTEIARRLIPRNFRTLGYELRATAEMVQNFSAYLEQARLLGAPQYALDGYEALLKDVRTAYSENRGRTGPLPLDSIFLPLSLSPTLDIPPATDRTGRMMAYTKPVMVLIDNLSFSAAEAFAAVMQDNQAALVFGTRTAGAGGPVRDYDGGAYSEAQISLTVGMMVRKDPVVTRDYPTAPYVENIGVRPDVEEDYMTRDNLLAKGKTFVEDFTGAMVSYILTK